MAQSSDELIKRLIVEEVGSIGQKKLRIFTQSSTDDQYLFANGGLTFGVNGVSYGSCDAAWFIDDEWTDPHSGKTVKHRPIVALEGTDALNRNSTGNAQYQRFHHALGAVKNGLIGIYYLRKGIAKIQQDLYGMAYFASKVEKGDYIITDNLDLVREIIEKYGSPDFDKFLASIQEDMYVKFKEKFDSTYSSSWEKFASTRSTIIKDDYVIKHAGRMRRNFTDSSQRAGHIAVGEMYLTKYYFYKKKMIYLFPKMTKEDIQILDKSKKVDKEWYLLRNEPNVLIKTADDIMGLEQNMKEALLALSDVPLKGAAMKEYSTITKAIVSGLESGKYKIDLSTS